MTDVAETEADAREPWQSRVPLRTMAIWLALVVIVFLTRNRWEAWQASRLPRRFGSHCWLGSAGDSCFLTSDVGPEIRLWKLDSNREIARIVRC
ncbi:MAG: hypothetical protein ACYSU0_18775, partial [Planctomycetota bacterium]